MEITRKFKKNKIQNEILEIYHSWTTGSMYVLPLLFRTII